MPNSTKKCLTKLENSKMGPDYDRSPLSSETQLLLLPAHVFLYKIKPPEYPTYHNYLNTIQL